MFITPICSEEILKLINLVDDKKSTDPYGMPVRLVKLSKNIICTYLSDIFNNCVRNGIFPDKLKLAKVIPIFKYGAKDIASNYRLFFTELKLNKNVLYLSQCPASQKFIGDPLVCLVC